MRKSWVLYLVVFAIGFALTQLVIHEFFSDTAFLKTKFYGDKDYRNPSEYFICNTFHDEWTCAPLEDVMKPSGGESL